MSAEKSPPAGREINVAYLARVEGEGGLYVKVSAGRVVDLRLNIFEPPRLFEAFLKNKIYSSSCINRRNRCLICKNLFLFSTSIAGLNSGADKSLRDGCWSI